MAGLLDLPMELLTLVLGHLELADLLRFCATCRAMRHAFKPEQLGWVMRTDRYPLPTLVQTLVLDKAIQNASYLFRCHTFLELFRRFGPYKDYDLLLQHGASFRSIATGRLLGEYFRRFGPGDHVDFLLKHGASLHGVPGGLHRLLEEALLDLDKNRAAYLFQRGASLRELPSGPEKLLADLLSKFGRSIAWQHVYSILQGIGPLTSIPTGFEHWLGRHFDPEKIELLLPHLPDAPNVLLAVALCKYGLGPEVDELLLRGASFDHLAATGDRQEDASGIVRAIRGGDIDAIGFTGKTALMNAVIVGHLDAVTFLLTRGADYEIQWNGGSPLAYAVKGGRLDIARLLLDRGASIDGNMAIQAYATERLPLLCSTAKQDQWEMTLLLLTHAANPDVLTDSGSTALHLAAERNLWGIVRILLDHGACSRLADADGYYPLTLAAAKGCRGAVKALANDYEMDNSDEGGRTALTVACRRGHLEIVKLLLDQGADSGRADGRKCTPLFAAASSGHVEIFQILLKQGVDIHATFRGQSPLYAAARRGYLPIVQALIDAGADVAVADGNGLTPLGTAVENRQFSTARVLINAGADVEARDSNDHTPLLIAASEDFSSGCRLLIQSGADPNATTSKGDSALHIAVREGFVATGMLLGKDVAVNRPNDDGETPIHMAARSGSLDLVRAFVTNGWSPDPTVDDDFTLVTSGLRRRKRKMSSSTVPAVQTRDPGGRTPLSLAAENGYAQMVQCLVDNGAQVDARDARGRTPLFEAAEKKHREIVAFLISKNAEVNAADRTGRTALHLAALHGAKDVAVSLIDAGAKQTASEDGMPIHFAANGGCPEVVTLLFEHGANVSARTDDGNTPLHLATKHPETIQSLLRCGATVDAINKRDRTPLANAVQFGSPQAAIRLAEAGADPNHESHGSTPFLAAVRSGLQEAVEALHRAGGHVDRCDGTGLTPLHHAASQGWLQVASFLAGQGADLQAPSPEGLLPWEVAVNHGHIEVAIAIMPELLPSQLGLLESCLASNLGDREILKMIEQSPVIGISSTATNSQPLTDPMDLCLFDLSTSGEISGPLMDPRDLFRS